jgi:hypothetical protein
MIEGIGCAGWRGREPDRVHCTLGRPGRPESIIRDGALDPASCPGRWNPKRSIPPETDPLSAAAALALEDAGWWRPGQEGPVTGALIAAIDGAQLLPAERFLLDLHGGRAPSPGDFLFSLPSSPAAVLGILFGLTDYQATVVGGEDVGLQALRHAMDLLELRRVDRVLLAVLSAADRSILSSPHQWVAATAGPVRSAVAWCLSPRSARPKYPVHLDLVEFPEGGWRALRVTLNRPGRKNGSLEETLRACCGFRGTAADAFSDASAWILHHAARGAFSPGARCPRPS